MKIANLPASKFPIPFANSAGAGYKRSIPVNSQIGITNGAASLTDGFPPLNFLPVGSGGVPPFGQDMNGVLNQITQWLQWQNAGGPLPYDSAFSTSIGGYPQGAVLAGATAGTVWLSIVDDNTSNPNTGGANWINIATSTAIQNNQYNFAVAGGTANALTATLSPIPTALVAGMSIRLKISTTNTGAATLTVNGLTPVAIQAGDGTAIPKNYLMAGQIVDLTYDGSAFRLQNFVRRNGDTMVAADASTTILKLIMAASQSANPFSIQDSSFNDRVAYDLTYGGLRVPNGLGSILTSVMLLAGAAGSGHFTVTDGLYRHQVEYGFYNAAGTGTTNVTFPIAFKTGTLPSILVLPNNSGALATTQSLAYPVSASSATGFTVEKRYVNNGGTVGEATQPFFWLGLGQV